MADTLSGVIDLVSGGSEPLHSQLQRQIKHAVLSGRLAAQTRLPSSRALAYALGVSRNTVLAALEQLKAEGYLEARAGSGTYVAALAEPGFAELRTARPATMRFAHRLASHWRRALGAHDMGGGGLPRPFVPGIPDVAAFPYELWGTLLRRASRRLDAASAAYGHMSGHPRLREVLSRHLAQVRGVVADPEQIIITSSARGGIGLIASALLEEGGEVWIEEPGFRSPKALFVASGATLRPIGVDGQGLQVSAAPPGSRPRLIYTTPSHQYPTGVMMTLDRRLQLLDVAARCNAYVIEDDYDSEFQFRGRPIAALQGLDRVGCVLYLGTFAKSLLPSLRVGFLVVPTALAEPLRRVHRSTGQLVSPILQLAIADFIDSGQYRAHVRRMKTLYADRLAAFAAGLSACSRERLSAAVPDGGMQTVVRAREDMADTVLAERLARAGIDCQPISDFCLEPAAARHRGVLMGFAAWPEERMKRALARLHGVFST